MDNKDQIVGDLGILADFVYKSVVLGCAIDTPSTPDKAANVVNASLNFAVALTRCIARSQRW